MSLSIKRGVSVLGLQMPMVLGLQVVADVYENLKLDCVITSGVEGKHGGHSHHKKGLAMDFRTRNVPEWQLRTLQENLASALQNEYQVILEKTHIHIEYDPV